MPRVLSESSPDPKNTKLSDGIQNFFASTYPLNQTLNLNTPKKRLLSSSSTHTNLSPRLLLDAISPNPYSVEEIVAAVRKSKVKSAPCPLGDVPYIVLKKCPVLVTALHDHMLEKQHQ